MATTRSSTKRGASPNLTGDNFDAGAFMHSERIPQVPGPDTRYTSVQGDNHEDPETGSHSLTYPSRGNG